MMGSAATMQPAMRLWNGQTGLDSLSLGTGSMEPRELVALCSDFFEIEFFCPADSKIAIKHRSPLTAIALDLLTADFVNLSHCEACSLFMLLKPVLVTSS